ncbi:MULTISPECIES: bifunctional tetrahydrofolate synthase/dihydrofolate synthase [Pseudomonas syringae group]|uniref:bifunctional tetrahydrofolate synthase/dihydrofolate synthase n=1 Tax=Pseudomonas syringae group TaxID=136849 RepID=UPI000F000D46|nr:MULTISPECIES: bifunctional tetrahydrofolate synthase/dihydrofolate synthase [Pseudomonas syringae group]MCF5715589.1 bifunctional tetrahydrofolate synthase/dihydrofolate synthase [Pseudomonas tremae]MCF5746209.1 bifunctional tetrahydrofolate synthase/dihydrofolate synthase [Pseudomonas tremae]RMN25663.1 Folylpolyglutamate synthetase [Pseudomonas coronafaciens pv. zizaniae]RMP20578.1 Folylpolyglutamate synthetase [Pseudomonas coronafaciens pv. atropurpurea]RMV64495.1 Folylpolyglutamate synth
MTLGSLGDWLAYLEQLHPSAIDMGLERSRQVAQQLGLLRPARRVITVTGTNGKGSTCAFVAALLQSQGLKVGIYSSPHLIRYNERVKVQGVEATDLELCNAFAAVEAARGDVTLTYFEMGTLAAFWLFEQAQLDVAVLEVGLGGRLDAVNLVDPDIALVTSIGVDHAEYLGNTRESVAFEKAGIFRSGRPALCGDPAPPEPLLAKARELGCPLLLRGRDFDLSTGHDSWNWRGLAGGEQVELHNLPLLDLPMQNAALALQAFALLGYPLQPEAVGRVLAETRLAGRLDRRTVRWQGKRLNLLLDVGHNPHAAHFLAQRMARRPVSGRRLAVFGLLSDKDLDGVITPLAAVIDEWAVAPLPTSRSRSAEELHSALENLGARVTSYQSVALALEAQCAHATTDDEILLFGSFYCVAEALEWLARHTDEDAANGFAG